MVHSSFAIESGLTPIQSMIAARLTRPPGGKGEAKAPLPSVGNLEIILGSDPDYHEHLGHNLFTDEVTWAGLPITDALETQLNCRLEATYRIRATTERVREVMQMIARAHPYHPVRDWLATLVWDGVPRIDGVLARYCGAAATPINRAIGRKWMLGAVSRVMVPGGQMDTTLILVGRQGAGKSSFFRAMVPRPEWFSDTAMDLGSKDAFQQLSGIWIYEVAELSALRARDAEAVKAFLTARADRYRPPYGRNVVRIDRQVVFVGTTNEAEFLDDPTGARRFWPVEAGAFDLDALAADRDQLWAEAFEIFTTADEEARQWHLTPDESEMLAEHHTRYARSDTWRDALEGWLSGVKLAELRVKGLTAEQALSEGLELHAREQHRGNSMRVASLLASMGWTKRKTVHEGQRAWRWFPRD